MLLPPHTPQPKKLQEFIAHATQVNCLALSPHSHTVLATGGDDRKINIFRLVRNATTTTNTNIACLTGVTSPVTCLAFEPTQEHHLAAGSEGGSLKIFDVAAGGNKVVRSLSGHMSGVTCVNYSSSSSLSPQLLVSGGQDASFKAWDLRAKKACIMTHKGHTTAVTDAQFSPDGRWCCSAGTDGILNAWDLRQRETIYTFELDTSKEGKPSPIHHFAFHPTQQKMATATADKVVRLFDTESFELLASSPHVLPGEMHPVRAMAFDGAGGLYTATEKFMRVLNEETMEVVATVENAPWEKSGSVCVLSYNKGQGVVVGCGVRGNVVSMYEAPIRAATEAPVPFPYEESHCAAAAGGGGSAPVEEKVMVVEKKKEEEESVMSSKEGEEPLSALTPSRMTRSMTRRNSLLSPPPAGMPTAVEKKTEEKAKPTHTHTQTQEAHTTMQPKQQPPAPAPTQPTVEAPPAGLPSSFSSSTTIHRQDQQQQQQTDKENQATTTTTTTTNRRQEQPQQQDPTKPTKPSSSTTTTTTTSSTPLSPTSRLAHADTEIIAATLLHRTTLTTTLSSRLAHLQHLAELWQKGKLPETFRLLHRLHSTNPQDNGRLTVLADFLNVIDLQLTASECGPLTLEVVCPLLPVVRSLLGIDFEMHVLAGLKTVEALVMLFGGFVCDVLQTPTTKGVDLSREERVEKCQLFHETMYKVHPRVVALSKSKAFKAGSSVHEAAGRVQGQLEGYLSAASIKK